MNVSVAGFKGIKILVVGDVMLDRYLWGKVRRISPEAPVPVVKWQKTTETLGGAGNVANNLAGLGCRVTVAGICGTDQTALALKKLLGSKGIQDSLVEDPSRPTITKTRVMAHKQQVLRIDEEDTQPVAPDIVKRVKSIVLHELKQCQAVILSDYGKGLFAASELTQIIIQQGKKQGLPVLVDPKGSNWQRYQGATCITPNTTELEGISGTNLETDEVLMVATARKIRSDLNLDCMLVTRGPHGMCLVSKDNAPVLIPAQAREVYDVSGAGDTVIATLAAALGAGHTFVDAAKAANLAAGVVVGKLGTQPILASELETALQFASLDAFQAYASSKIAVIENALAKIRDWQVAGKKIVFTNGCFDLLHPGHISLLHQARALGDRLIVGLNTDASIRRLKGKDRPILSEQDRAAILSALECVDLVVCFDEDTPLNLITVLRPDILVKGADYAPEQVVGKDIVEAYGGQVKLVNLVQGYSTTKITEKVLAAKPKP